MTLAKAKAKTNENIYGTGVTYDHHLQSYKYVYSTGHWLLIWFAFVHFKEQLEAPWRLLGSNSMQKWPLYNTPVCMPSTKLQALYKYGLT
jgi:hypothetical protein